MKTRQKRDRVRVRERESERGMVNAGEWKLPYRIVKFWRHPFSITDLIYNLTTNGANPVFLLVSTMECASNQDNTRTLSDLDYYLCFRFFSSSSSSFASNHLPPFHCDFKLYIIICSSLLRYTGNYVCWFFSFLLPLSVKFISNVYFYANKKN